MSRPLNLWRALPTLLAATSGACISRDVSELDPHPTGEILKDVPVSADIDILFIIDDSGSTQDKQTLFKANFPRFIQALDSFPSGRPNVHIGVTSSSADLGYAVEGSSCHPAAGLNGLLQNTDIGNTCTGPTDRWISDIAGPNMGPRITNYSGQLQDVFSCIATRGTNGCGYENQLESMKRALDGTNPQNNGFIRQGAYLAVVELTDEEDCSAADRTMYDPNNAAAGAGGEFRCYHWANTCDQPISDNMSGTYTNCHYSTMGYFHDPKEYADFSIHLKGDPALIVAAAIMGDPSTTLSVTKDNNGIDEDKSCSATIGGNNVIARPGNRIQGFLSAFGGHGLFRTVCQSDYTSALADIGNLIFNAVTPCLEGNVNTADIAPNDPGLQIDCQVSDTQFYNTTEQTETVMPRCPMNADNTPAAGARPCWWVKQNAVTCSTTPTHLELHVERSTDPPPNTHVRVRCADAE